MAAARPYSPLVVLLAGSALFLGFLSFPSAADNVLYPGGSLISGQSLSQGNYSLIMQSDCNLVLYNCDLPLWASQTYGWGNGCRAVMQRDGNLVVYTATGRLVWASHTQRSFGSYVLVLQPSGDVVIYGRATWSTGTRTRGPGGMVDGVSVEKTAFPATPGVRVVKAGKGRGADHGGN